MIIYIDVQTTKIMDYLVVAERGFKAKTNVPAVYLEVVYVSE